MENNYPLPKSFRFTKRRGKKTDKFLAKYNIKFSELIFGGAEGLL